MIKFILKIAAAILLVALVILAFVKILSWALGIIAALALVKFGHDWLCRHGLPAWWPCWKKDNQPQNAA